MSRLTSSLTSSFAIAAAAIAVLVATAPGAQAQVLGYSLNISGNTDSPTLRFTNNSSPGIQITSIQVGVGAIGTHNFDAAFNEAVGSTGIVFNLVTPDAVNGGTRADQLQYIFSGGYDPGDDFAFDVDIDQDNFDSTVDYRNVLFNNGEFVSNAVIIVSFSQPAPVIGTTLSMLLPDARAPQETYTFSQSSLSAAAAPEPVTLALLGMGLLAPVAGAVVRRRRR